MSNETKHTLDQPWTLKEQGPNVDPLVVDGAGWIVCQTAKQHAKYIVRACNAHDELVKALEEIAKNDPFKVSSAGDIARAALALAQNQA